jgi:hypothetical protein
MGRSLIWIQGDGDAGWACSNCSWRFPVPTLLTAEEARDAYDRLAAAKFRDHECEAKIQPAPAKQNAGPTRPNVADRARMLIKGGFKPKDAVEVVLQEIEFEYRSEPGVIKQARLEAEDFLLKIRKGLI